jgi:hypothetical protein
LFIFFLATKVPSDFKSSISEDIDPQAVFQFIRRICTKKNGLTKEKLFIRVRGKFNLSKASIEILFQDFIDQRLLIFNDSGISIDILANPVRKNIINLIEKQPGIYINRLKHHLQIDSYQLLWHLGILKKFQFIKEIKIGKIIAFGLLNESAFRIIIGCIIQKDSINLMLKILVNDQNGKSQTELAEIIKTPRSNIIYWTKRLVDEKILEIKKNGSQKAYILSNEAVKIINTF